MSILIRSERNLKSAVLAVCLLTGLAVFPRTCLAAGSSGVEVGLDSARALGKGNAVVADPQDASTLVYNPAGMTQLKGVQIATNFTTLIPVTNYTKTSGVSEDGASLPAYIPSFFMSLDTPIERFRIGGGVNAPFGIQNQWSSTGSFKYTGFSSSIKSMYYTLDGAYEMAPWLSVAGGASYVEVSAKQLGKLNSNFITISNGGPAGQPDANTEVDARGSGQGWNMGVLLKPQEKWSVGFFYRGAVRVRVDGEYDADNLQGPIMQAIFGGSSFHTNVDTDIIFPDSAVVGANYQVSDKLDVEADFGWTGWEKFDHFDFNYTTTNAVLAANDPSQHQFRNTFSVNVGAAYKLNSNWDLMAGYAYFERAALEPDYSNVFLDSDRHNATVGLQYHTDKFSVALTYAAQFLPEIGIDNNVGSISNVSIDGDYKGFYHVILTSMTFHFG